MTYAVSDIHGCYDKYRELLRVIRFCPKDTLYVLGDVIDRGPVAGYGSAAQCGRTDGKPRGNGSSSASRYHA